jgi:hypothetical protein
MAISSRTRQQVRQRATFACEYCGASETNVGGELTIDHYQPISKGGGDQIDNLIYACSRCNEYKGDYYPLLPSQIFLWNPRNESASHHFLLLADYSLYPITRIGEFTITHLHLNRPALIAHRRSRQSENLIERLADQLTTITSTLLQIREENQEMFREQLNQLEQQRLLLLYLLQGKDE